MYVIPPKRGGSPNALFRITELQGLTFKPVSVFRFLQQQLYSVSQSTQNWRHLVSVLEHYF